MHTSRVGWLVAVTLAVAASATGCGEKPPGGLITAGEPPTTPYSGPLRVPHKDSDEDSVAAAKARSGAAGLALECDGDIHDGEFSDVWSDASSKGDGGASPEEGLRLYFEMDGGELPEYGYRVEREEAERVLYSFDVEGRTKVAVIVAKDQPRRPGWGPETSAWCDPAEFPPDFTDKMPYEIWTDRDGDRVPISKVSSSAGPEHCDWQEAHFLEMGRGADRKTYVRDPKGVLERKMLASRYDKNVTMPADAQDTGYRLDDWRLWVAVDASKAYVRTPEGVEAWPMVKEGVGCK